LKLTNGTNLLACYSGSPNEGALLEMKILYIGNGLTHYYNLVLSQLNSEPSVELVVVAPAGAGANIGEGVYQTRDGINFKVIELEETRRFRFYTTFKGLARVLRQEQPDVVIVIESYLRAFLFETSVVAAMKSIRAGLILKSIPFRYTTYREALKNAESVTGFASLPSFANSLFRKLGLIRLAKRCILFVNRRALNLPDAHVNYVEAYEYWESYGIPRGKIFITRNSPDTDMLFSIREKIESEPRILPHNPFRLLHVGRLVEWKRVDMLLRAFARIKVSFPDSELLVIGSGPEEENLKKLAVELQLGKSVSFLGGIYDQQLLGQYYLVSSLYVLAGMGGLSINEAMCFGLPILCSVCDGTEKMLVKEGVNGKYFRDGDEDDLLDKITWFFERPYELKHMGLCSEKIIRNEVNIRTVINGYVDALRYAVQRKTGETYSREFIK
jgi:glycosyltransferase involved in cell wall biosynthesis